MVCSRLFGLVSLEQSLNLNRLAFVYGLGGWWSPDGLTPICGRGVPLDVMFGQDSKVKQVLEVLIRLSFHLVRNRVV